MVFETIRKIIAEQLNIEEDKITEETNLMKDLVADSIEAAEIIAAIEMEYDIEIADEDAEKFHTVEDIVEYIEERI